MKQIFALLLLTLLSCASCATSDNGGIPTYYRGGVNNMTVQLVSEAVDSQLPRSIVVFHMTNDEGTADYQYRQLLFAGIHGGRHLYAGEDGSVYLERAFVNPDGSINYKLFAECTYEEVFKSVEVIPCPQKQTRADREGFIVVPGQPAVQRTARMPSICTIQAVNYQAQLKQKYGDRLAWDAILSVFYTKEGKPTGHSYCAFRLINKNAPTGEEQYIRNQTFYVYDEHGERKIEANRYDALTIGNMLKANVTSAQFEEK